MPNPHLAPRPAGLKASIKIDSRSGSFEVLRVEVHRELRWLEIVRGPYELDAYWAGKTMHHRWHRFEIAPHGVAVGPLMVLARKQKPVEEPQLTVVEGER